MSDTQGKQTNAASSVIKRRNMLPSSSLKINSIPGVKTSKKISGKFRNLALDRGFKTSRKPKVINYHLNYKIDDLYLRTTRADSYEVDSKLETILIRIIKNLDENKSPFEEMKENLENQLVSYNHGCEQRGRARTVSGEAISLRNSSRMKKLENSLRKTRIGMERKLKRKKKKSKSNEIIRLYDNAKGYKYIVQAVQNKNPEIKDNDIMADTDHHSSGEESFFETSDLDELFYPEDVKSVT